MSRPHSADCEHADVGSLCDCDCAGSRHAVKRTKGAVPGAGAVSRRAQRIAARDNRAAVVNNKAVANGVGRNGKPDPEPVKPPPPPPDPVKPPPPPDPVKPPPPDPEPVKPPAARRPKAGGQKLDTAAKPARLSPTTTAQLQRVRDALPTGDSGWKDAAKVVADPGEQKRLTADAAKKMAAFRKAADAEKDWLDAKTAELSASYVDAGLDKQTAYLEAKFRAQTQFAEYDKLHKKASRLNLAAARARLAADDAAQGGYPIDPATGLPMPSPELDKHLDSVVQVGRRVLAEAKQVSRKDAPPEVAAAVDRVDGFEDLLATHRALINMWPLRAPNIINGQQIPDEAARQRLEDASRKAVNDARKSAEADRRVVAAHEQKVLLGLLAAHRGFGGTTHTQAVPATSGNGGPHGATAARTDWEQQLTAAEKFFPTAWLDESAKHPLTVGASSRAYYSERGQGGLLSMPTRKNDANPYDGAFRDYTAEVNVHEFGHRMETLIPGLTHLEFALVRRHGRDTDGSTQKVAQLSGYPKGEVGQRDRWARGYTGKSYEQGLFADRPGESAWEAFQVGLQDTFGRSRSNTYGHIDDPDELQAFTIGALLTLG